MGLNDIVTVEITRETTPISVASFGIPMIASEFATSKTTPAFTRARSYSTLAEMVADGWSAPDPETPGSGDPEYLKAQALFTQNPRPSRVIIGRKDSTDANWAAALDAIQAENDEWYGLLAIPDGTFSTDVTAIATWVESQRKIYFVQALDTAILTNGTSDIAYLLKTAARDRTAVIYHLSANSAQEAEAAWMGEGFPYDPGTSTWAYKDLAGVTPDTFTSSQRGYALGKNCNIFHIVGGARVTENGKVASGEYIDVIIGVDWIQARLQEAVYGALVNNRKLPYDDGGITAVVGLVKGVLLEAANRGILQRDSIIVTAPKYSEISSADKLARKLPDVTFTALLVGAIHSTEIQGTVSV